MNSERKKERKKPLQTICHDSAFLPASMVYDRPSYTLLMKSFPGVLCVTTSNRKSTETGDDLKSNWRNGYSRLIHVMCSVHFTCRRCVIVNLAAEMDDAWNVCWSNAHHRCTPMDRYRQSSRAKSGKTLQRFSLGLCEYYFNLNGVFWSQMHQSIFSSSRLVRVWRETDEWSKWNGTGQIHFLQSALPFHSVNINCEEELVPILLIPSILFHLSDPKESS